MDMIETNFTVFSTQVRPTSSFISSSTLPLQSYKIICVECNPPKAISSCTRRSTPDEFAANTVAESFYSSGQCCTKFVLIRKHTKFPILGNKILRTLKNFDRLKKILNFLQDLISFFKICLIMDFCI